MNNDKRIFAFVSLGLVLSTMRITFIITTLGRENLVIGFAIVAGLLAQGPNRKGSKPTNHTTRTAFPLGCRTVRANLLATLAADRGVSGGGR